MEEKSIISSLEIGKRIKYRRRELSLTQEELAAILDVSYQQIQRYESGKDRLNTEKLQGVAYALSVQVSYFFSPNGCEIAPLADASEKELISHYRKVRHAEVKALMVNFLNMVARWENDWDGV